MPTFATAAEVARRAGYSDAQVAAAGSAILDATIRTRQQTAEEHKLDAEHLAALDARPAVALDSEAARGEYAFAQAAVSSAWMSIVDASAPRAADINAERAAMREFYRRERKRIPDKWREEGDLPDDGRGPATML